MTAVTVVVVLLVGVVLWLTPTLSKDTVPLGVSVPQERVTDPVVRSAISRFRAGIVAVTIGAVVLALLLGSALPEVAGLAPLLVVIAGGVCFAVSRSAIVAAKQDGDWYADVPGVLRASVTPTEPPSVPRSVWSLFVVAALLPFVAIVLAVARWSSLPDRIPTHFGVNGTPDGWTSKGPGLLLGIAAFALLPVLFALISWLMLRSPANQGSDRERVAVQRRATVIGLGWMAVLVNAAIAVTFVVILTGADAGAVQACAIGTLVATFVGVAIMLGLVARASRRTGREVVDPVHDAPDDDQHWKWGMFYVNRDDPRLMVDKRVGIGITVNFGHPAGRIIAIVLVLLVAATILIPLIGALTS